jgi:flagellar FliL protein
MKKVIMTITALALLGGTAAGGYVFFMKPAEASETSDTKEEKKADKGAKDAAVSFVQMSPLVLPIVDKNGVSQIISLVISLEVRDDLSAKEVERMTPRLKDAYIQDMYGVLTKQAAMEGGVVQVGYIKNRLNQVTTKIMGKDRVNDVLLQVVQQRPV